MYSFREGGISVAFLKLCLQEELSHAHRVHKDMRRVQVRLFFMVWWTFICGDWRIYTMGNVKEM